MATSKPGTSTASNGLDAAVQSGWSLNLAISVLPAVSAVSPVIVNGVPVLSQSPFAIVVSRTPGNEMIRSSVASSENVIVPLKLYLRLPHVLLLSIVTTYPLLIDELDGAV